MIKKITKNFFLFLLTILISISNIFAKGTVPGSLEGVNTSSRPDLMKHIFDGMINQKRKEADKVLIFERIGLQFYQKQNVVWSIIAQFYGKDIILYPKANSIEGMRTSMRLFLKDLYMPEEFGGYPVRSKEFKDFLSNIAEISALPGEQFIYRDKSDKWYLIDHSLNSWTEIINSKTFLFEGKDIKTRINNFGDFCYLLNDEIKCFKTDKYNKIDNYNSRKLGLYYTEPFLNKGYLNFFIDKNYIILHNKDKSISVIEFLGKEDQVYSESNYSLPIFKDNNFGQSPFHLDYEIVCENESCGKRYNTDVSGYNVREINIKAKFHDIGLFYPSFNNKPIRTVFEYNGNNYFSVPLSAYGNKLVILKIKDSAVENFKNMKKVLGQIFIPNGDTVLLPSLSTNAYPLIGGYQTVGVNSIENIFITGEDQNQILSYVARVDSGKYKDISTELGNRILYLTKYPKEQITERLAEVVSGFDVDPIGGFSEAIGTFLYQEASGLISSRNNLFAKVEESKKASYGKYNFIFAGSNWYFQQDTIGKFLGNIKSGDIRDNCDLQGNYGGGCPIQNACKILQDPKSMSENGLITGACPPGKEVLPGEIGFKTSGAGSGLNCVHIVEDDMVKAAKPIIDTSIEGKCSATNCTGIEPWYQADNLNNILIKTTLRPQTLTFTKGLTTPHTYQGELYLDTLSVYVNGVKLANNGVDSQITPLNPGIPLSGHTSQPVPFSIRLNGEGGARGNKGINYINIEICDYVFDDNHKAIPPNRKYLLNCTTESLVVKIDPSQDDEANDGFNLNQKVKNCNDLGYTLTEGSEWMFPVQADGTYIESCNKENTNCVPKAKNVCNFQCAKGYIKDGNKCVLETKQLNCNDKLGALLPNEEWNNPPNVHPIYGTFMAQYKTLYHTYVPTLDYCQKKCKLGYQRDINGGCSELRKERQCGVIDGENDNTRRLGNFERFVNDTTELVDPVTSLPNEGLTKLPFQQFWEDKPDNTGYFDSLLDTNTEYQPPKDTYCAIEQIPGIVPLNGINVCPMGQTGLDYNEDGIIGTCYNNEIKYVDTTTTPEAGKENYTICFYSYNNENEPQQYPYHDFITKNGQIPLVGYTFADPSDISYHDYKYSAGQVPLCINKPQAGLKNSQGRLVPIP